ncbi:MAG: methyltransferase domain-containing protein [Deferribacteraceae bacterium]|nr:methyltransferase domain-containing protein [Deferribacteraceae bacterium]
MKNNARKEFWEIRSKSFPGYTQGESYQTRMLEVMKDNHVNFSGKTVLDLGCGTGAYTIHIAKEAAHVTALDISEGMLAKVKAAAANENINNISYVCSDWLEFQEQKQFDIVFCSLTPAICDRGAVQKAHGYAAEQLINICMTGGMNAHTLRELYSAHGIERKTKNSLEPHVRNWLDENNFDYKIVNVKGAWETFRSFDDMLANFRDVLEANKYEVDDTITQKYTQQLKDEGTGLYKSITHYDVEMIIHNIKQQGLA